MVREAWDVFHRQVPFIGSGGPYSPGPRTVRAPSRVCRRPVNGALTPFWAFAGPRPSSRFRPTCARPFARFNPRRMTADDRSELGPCSLAATLFRSEPRERIRDQSPPTDFCNTTDVRALQPELSLPRRDEGMDLLPFLTRHATVPLAEERNDERRAAHRPDRLTSVSVPLTYVSLPDRDGCRPASHPPTRKKEGCRSNCRDERDARVLGPSEGRVLVARAKPS